MKYITLLILSIVVLSPVFGQIGINTQNPKGVFHIDAKGDDSLLNDLLVTTDGSGGVNMGLGAIPTISSQLTLSDTNKALKLNRVALKSITDRVTIPAPQRGLIVYNTTINESLTEAIYYYSGYRWVRLETTPYNGEIINQRNLVEGVKTIDILSDAIKNGRSGGIELRFSNIKGEGIKVPEDGSYAFSFRLYGSPNKFTNATEKGRFYIFMVRKSDSKLLDSAELDILIYSGRPISYTIALAAILKKNDEVLFYLGHLEGAKYTWSLGSSSATAVNANRTSMIYWKF